METIALLGATGSLGRALGRGLSSRGIPYRAVGRSALALQVRFAPDPLAETVLWDAEDEGSVRATLEGASTAVYLAGVPVWEFGKHIPLTERVLRAAGAAGVKRLLLVSSTWAYGLPQAARVSEQHPLAAHTAKGRVRAEQEQMVLAAHATDGVQTTVLRCADFYGPYVEASYLWSAFRAAKIGGHAQLMSPVDTPHEFVYVPDAARTILRVLEASQVWGRAWNLGGAGTTTLRAMTEEIFSAAGRAPNYETPPRWKMGVVAALNPYVRAMREMQYLLETPVLLEDEPLAAVLGGPGGPGGLEKTPYRQGIEETLPTVRVSRR